LQDQSQRPALGKSAPAYLFYDELLSAWEVRDDDDLGVLGVARKALLVNMSLSTD
jgi:hypothetical protein